MNQSPLESFPARRDLCWRCSPIALSARRMAPLRYAFLTDVPIVIGAGAGAGAVGDAVVATKPEGFERTREVPNPTALCVC